MHSQPNIYFHHRKLAQDDKILDVQSAYLYPYVYVHTLYLYDNEEEVNFKFGSVYFKS